MEHTQLNASDPTILIGTAVNETIFILRTPIIPSDYPLNLNISSSLLSLLCHNNKQIIGEMTDISVQYVFHMRSFI